VLLFAWHGVAEAGGKLENTLLLKTRVNGVQQDILLDQMSLSGTVGGRVESDFQHRLASYELLKVLMLLHFPPPPPVGQAWGSFEEQIALVGISSLAQRLSDPRLKQEITHLVAKAATNPLPAQGV
jgi:hypothetical protein